MEIEFMAEFTEGMSRDRARKIIKRKRTRRQRPCSPFSICTTSTETTDNCLIVNCIDQSPVTSSCDTTTKEDEDMANCLILLAQSVYPEENYMNICQSRNKTERLNSRKFAEINSLTVGKSVLYAYECKTCNRTFPSFQALGGHRASHKKPKGNVEVKETNSDNNNNDNNNNNNNIMTTITTPYGEETEEFNNSVMQEEKSNKLAYISPNNVQTGVMNNSMKPKVHECSICGSEFLSGQALGGHMRKHRPVNPSSNRTGISLIASNDESFDNEIVETSQHKNNGLLSLDLNFPPPEVVVEDHRSTFALTGGSSQQHMVFSSSPAFVDCHY